MDVAPTAFPSRIGSSHTTRGYIFACILRVTTTSKLTRVASRRVGAQAAISPLFLALGLGVVGSTACGLYYLSKSRESGFGQNFEGWSKMQEGHNTNLMAFDTEFWQGCANDLFNARSWFVSDDHLHFTSSDQIKQAKQHAIEKAAKARNELSLE